MGHQPKAKLIQASAVKDREQVLKHIMQVAFLYTYTSTHTPYSTLSSFFLSLSFSSYNYYNILIKEMSFVLLSLIRELKI